MLFEGKAELEKELDKIDLDGMTPLEALNKLYELKKKMGEREYQTLTLSF